MASWCHKAGSGLRLVELDFHVVVAACKVEEALHYRWEREVDAQGLGVDVESLRLQPVHVKSPVPKLEVLIALAAGKSAEILIVGDGRRPCGVLQFVQQVMDLLSLSHLGSQGLLREILEAKQISQALPLGENSANGLRVVIRCLGRLGHHCSVELLP